MLRALVFLWIALAAIPALAQDDSAPKPEGMVLLTIGGFVGKSNRGPVDPQRDTTLARIGADFKRGYDFDREMLLALPQGTVKIDAPGFGKDAEFSGPYLRDVLVAVEGAQVKTRFVAIDGYSGFFAP